MRVWVSGGYNAASIYPRSPLPMFFFSFFFLFLATGSMQRREAYVCVEKARKNKTKKDIELDERRSEAERESVCVFLSFFLSGTGSCGINHGGSQLSREGIYATADPKKRGTTCYAVSKVMAPHARRFVRGYSIGKSAGSLILHNQGI